MEGGFFGVVHGGHGGHGQAHFFGCRIEHSHSGLDGYGVCGQAWGGLGVKGFKGRRVQGLKSSRVEGFKGRRVQGLKSSRVGGFAQSRVAGGRKLSVKEQALFFTNILLCSPAILSNN